ncbi:MarR family transcriptional regulator [Luteimonas sp. BDR2-5]|uniref:MarR family winged helix-turn-helix transcriptional regulator n=1 Tax=Proluteimonas luteida TaxID=2878685 RepID=UPI001E2C1837|nr:MarR family transcriptional regulator [Luteimonas sp. BDR2-5]MCD9030005.1 MarR family transcriptional regulator [Luteimonas sp. BDR2-5]
MFESCLYFNTAALARQLERWWAAAFAPFGLTPSQAFLLRTVLQHPGLAPFEIADMQVIARPTATRLLDALESKGLLVRKASAHDGRAQTIHPTPAAQAMREALNQASAGATRRIKRRIGDDAFSAAVVGVRNIRSAME